MKISKILVIGGTGMLGFPVVQQLNQDGYHPHIHTSNKAAALRKYGEQYSYIEGDVRNPDQLMKVFDSGNYQGVHISLSSTNYKDLEDIEVAGTTNVINAAQTHSIQKVTLISGIGVKESNSWSRFIKAKLKIEKVVVNSGIPYTIFNCTHFMESISRYIRNHKITQIGKQPHAVHWVAAQDYAQMVSKSFKTEESNNKIISVLGPEALTMREAFHHYIKIIDPSLKYSEVPLGALRLIARLTFNKSLKYLTDLMEYFEKVREEPVAGTINDVLDKPSTTLQEWLSMHKS